MNGEITEILTEELDEEILGRMPEWFRILREGYKKRQLRQMFS